MFRIVKEKKKSLFQLNWCQEGSEAAQCNHPDLVQFGSSQCYHS